MHFIFRSHVHKTCPVVFNTIEVISNSRTADNPYKEAVKESEMRTVRTAAQSGVVRSSSDKK